MADLRGPLEKLIFSSYRKTKVKNFLGSQEESWKTHTVWNCLTHTVLMKVGHLSGSRSTSCQPWDEESAWLHPEPDWWRAVGLRPMSAGSSTPSGRFYVLESLGNIELRCLDTRRQKAASGADGSEESHSDVFTRFMTEQVLQRSRLSSQWLWIIYMSIWRTGI